MEQKTPLYETHVNNEAKMVPFGGFIMPVHYKAGIIKEHMAVRLAAGLFDVSHMGEFFLTGADALANLQNLLTNDFSKMSPGGIKYSPMCNEKGGVVDDLLVYKREQDYMLVVNASNRQKDYDWIKSHLAGDVSLTDASDSMALLALQGPAAMQILERLTDPSSIPQKYYTFAAGNSVGNIPALISRTGYTGEDGFEFYIEAGQAAALWELLMNTGADLNLLPCGLGARDTLRLEASMPLYGHEMDEEVTPLEAGLGLFVKMDKENFIGKQALLNNPPQRKRVGLNITGRGIAREHSDVYLVDKKVGVTTSGTMCPFVDKAIAMALVDLDAAKVGTSLSIDVRGRRVSAEVVKLPFYKKA